MKKSIIIILLVGIVIAAIYFIFKNKETKSKLADKLLPTVQWTTMEIVNIEENKADINFIMGIDNPGPVGIKIDSLAYTFFINDVEVGHSSYPHTVDVESNDTISVKLPFTLLYKKFAKTIKDLQRKGNDSANYKIKTVVYNKILPNNKLEVEKEKLAPLLYIPETKITSIRVSSVNTKGAKIEIESIIKNENVFPLAFKETRYKIYLADQKPMTGNMPELLEIPAKGSAKSVMPVEVNFKEFGKSMIDIIKNGKETPYKMDMKCTMVSKEKMINNSKFTTIVEGNLKDLKQIVKK